MVFEFLAWKNFSHKKAPEKQLEKSTNQTSHSFAFSEPK
jgi:hypothetical protein